MTSYALGELPWGEVEAAFARDPRLIFPIGALEQHGPHLPIGANTVIAERVAEEVSHRLSILRAPTFSYGVTVGRGPYAGRTGLTRKTLHRVVNELFAGWEDQGVEEFVIITAHRYDPHLEPLLMALTREAAKSVYDLYEIDCSDLVESDPEWEHAGELETSLMLHLTPELVRTDDVEDFMPEGGALRRYTRQRVPKPPKGSTGVLGFPSRATAEKGALIFERYVDMLASTLGSNPGSTPPARTGVEPEGIK